MNTTTTTQIQASAQTDHVDSGRQARRLVLLLLACVAVVLGPVTSASAETVVIGGPGQRPQPGTVQLSSAGYTGQRQMIPSQWCTKLSGTSGIQSATFFAFRAPAYEAYTQTITMDVRLDYLAPDGRTWVPLTWAASQTSVTRPGQYPRYAVRSFTVTPNYAYRIVHVFTWSVNGTIVGRTYDAVNGDAITTNSLDGSVVKSVGTAQGWCAFYR